MYELNKCAVHPHHSLLWGHWKTVCPLARGRRGGGGGVVSQEPYYGGEGLSLGAFRVPLVSFHEVSKECGLMIMGGLGWDV